MGVASAFVARLLERYHWLAYVGIAVVGFVAVDMIWRGTQEVRALL
jgi:predicted tellurium resistance membrane protein TerC